jgi:Domain of unknown function (DUF222)/HNH endonuclease
MHVSPGCDDRSVFDVLTELEGAIEKVAADESMLDVERMCRLAERVEFLRLRAIGAYARSGAWQLNDSLTAAAGLRDRCRMNAGHALRDLDVARKLDQLPELAAAFGAGEVSRRHVEVVTDRATPERAEMLRGVEHELVDYARISTPRELRAVVRRMTDAFDGDGGAEADEAEHAKNTVSVSLLAGRGVLSGDLDAESTEIVATALDAELEARAPPDEEPRDRRPIPQRRADALVAICRLYMASRTDGPGPRRGRTHVSVVADVGALTGITDELLAALRIEAAHVGQVSIATLERLTCDCKLSRILMDGPSQVLDVGRATRTVGTALWNALVARDQHCSHPGCTRPPAYCEAHHIVHWSKGGPTSLANLKLLCWEHHRKHHRLDARRRE